MVDNDEAWSSRVRVYEDIISTEWVERLREFVISTPREQNHTYWLAGGAPTLLAQLVARLRRVVRAEGMGAEVWWRAQNADSGYRYHFDRDEAVHDHVISPPWSSILYLSDEGGETIVAETRANRIHPPRSVIGIQPRRARFAVFSGELFHGVRPGAASIEPRLALFINWWVQRPRSVLHELTTERLPPMAETPLPAELATFTPVPFDAAEVFDEVGWRQQLVAAQIRM